MWAVPDTFSICSDASVSIAGEMHRHQTAAPEIPERSRTMNEEKETNLNLYNQSYTNCSEIAQERRNHHMFYACDGGRFRHYLTTTLDHLQPCTCLSLAKGVISYLQPSLKGFRHNERRPTWWPPEIPYRNPYHLKKDCRLSITDTRTSSVEMH